MAAVMISKKDLNSDNGDKIEKRERDKKYCAKRIGKTVSGWT